jgi:monoamine oxidase
MVLLATELNNKYLTAPQEPHGNVHFASADWSDDWRGWIDLAVQAGMKAAHEVIEKQRK